MLKETHKTTVKFQQKPLKVFSKEIIVINTITNEKDPKRENIL